MTDQNVPFVPDTNSLSAVIAGFLEGVAGGHTSDREQILAAYPDLADDLRAFFADHDKMTQAAAPVRAALGDDCRRTGSLVCPAPAETFPQPFGDYELLEEIGRGGMGIVYKARQISLNRVVALKRIRAGQLASAEEVARFRREAQAAAGLDHPHIVPILEVGEHEGQHFFTMKLIEGGNLGGHLARFADAKASAGVMIKIARAVHHAHQRGILHRDLKPGNILIDADGSPHVSDFGLAQPIEKEAKLTQSGAIVGTAEYMAPEQARGEKGLTTAADVYGLGAILYVLLTGRPPFQGDYNWETLKKVVEEEPVSPRSLNRKANRDLETICLKCLAKLPAKRYGSAETLAEDLQRWLENRPILARPTGRWGRLKKWARRSPASAAALAVALVAAVCLAGLGLWIVAERLEHARIVTSKEEEITQRTEVIEGKEKLLDDQDFELARSKWSLLFNESKVQRQAGSRWDALAGSKKLAEQLRNNPKLGDGKLLRHEAFLAVNMPGIRLLRTVEKMPHVSGWKSQFSPDGSTIMFVAGGRDDGLTVHALTLPNGKLVKHKKSEGSIRLRGIWFSGEGARIKILTNKGFIVWDPVLDEDIEEVADEGWQETRIANYKPQRRLLNHTEFRYETLTTPDGKWHARGNRLWQTGGEKNSKPLLPHPVLAVLSNDILLLEGWPKERGGADKHTTVAWSISEKAPLFEIPGFFLAKLNEDLILMQPCPRYDPRYFGGSTLPWGDSIFWATWSIKDKKRVWALAGYYDTPMQAGSIVASFASPMGQAPILGLHTLALAERIQPANSEEWGGPLAFHLANSRDWGLLAFQNSLTRETEIWDTKAGKLLTILPQAYSRTMPDMPWEKFHRCVFSPDGRYFVFAPGRHIPASLPSSGSYLLPEEKQIHVWDRHSGTAGCLGDPSLRHFTTQFNERGFFGKDGNILRGGEILAAFPEGASQFLVDHRESLSQTGEKVELWDLESKQLLDVMDVRFKSGADGKWHYASPFSWSPDGRFIAAFPSSREHYGSVHFFEINYPPPTYSAREKSTNVFNSIAAPYGEEPIFGDRVTTLRFSPDGATLAVNGKTWEVRRANGQTTLVRPNPDVGADMVFFENSGEVWHVNLPKRDGPKGAPIRLRLSGVHGFEFKPPIPVAKEPGYQVQVLALGVSPSGQKIVVLFGSYAPGPGSHDALHFGAAQLQLWTRKGAGFELAWNIGSVKDGKRHVASEVAVELAKNPLPLDQRIVFTPDEQRFLVMGTRHDIGFDIATKSIYMWSDSWNNENPSVYSSDWDIRLRGSEISQGMTIRLSKEDKSEGWVQYQTRRALPGAVVKPAFLLHVRVPVPCITAALALSPNKKLAAVACEDNVVRIYDIASAKELWHVQAHPGEVTAMAFSPDGKILVTAGKEGTLKVWNLDDIFRELKALGLPD